MSDKPDSRPSPYEQGLLKAMGIRGKDVWSSGSYFRTMLDQEVPNTADSAWDREAALRAQREAYEARGNSMSTIKVKSNSLKDNIISFGSVTLRFDGAGIATTPAVHRAAVEQLMATRPGRFCIVEDETVPAPAPVEVKGYEEAKAEEEAAAAAEEDAEAEEPVVEETVEEPKKAVGRYTIPEVIPEGKVRKSYKKKASSKKS